jgi:hypothetical protein
VAYVTVSPPIPLGARNIEVREIAASVWTLLWLIDASNTAKGGIVFADPRMPAELCGDGNTLAEKPSREKETIMSTAKDTGAADLPDYAPIPQSALGQTLNDQGYFVGRVERNLYWVTDGVYQSAFLTTRDGVVLFDAPPSIGGNLRRAVDEIAAANGVPNTVRDSSSPTNTTATCAF